MELPKLPTWESFNNHLNSLDESERIAIFEYIKDGQIIGNPVLENYFIVERSAVLTLQSYQKAAELFKQDFDKWASTLEPQLNETATEFFKGMAQYTASTATSLALVGKKISEQTQQASRELQGDLKRFVEFGAEQLSERLTEHEASLDNKLEVLMAQLGDKSDGERRRVTKALTETLNSKLAPVVSVAFKASSDRFTLKAITRDFGIVFLAMALCLGLKAAIF